MIINPPFIPLPPSPAPSNSISDTTNSNLSSETLAAMTPINEATESGNSIKVLESHNFHQWNDLMQLYFLEHNLDGIVDGTEPQPDSIAPGYQNWILRQKKAAGFIARKLDSSNRDLFLNDQTRRNPHALWAAIEVKYASKKARNCSRLFTRSLSLNCADGDLSKYTASLREIVCEMSNSGVKLDDDLLAHMALHHLPPAYQTTLQVIIATAKSSDTALTVNGVSSQITELIRDGDCSKTSATALNLRTRPQHHQHQSLVNYERCTNGSHNPKTAHSAESCWQLHPNKHPNSNHRPAAANSAIISG